MDISKFDYDLPNELIANHPSETRTSSQLLISNDKDGEPKAAFEAVPFYRIVDNFNENDVLIFNDTKVIPARLFCEKETGGKVEVFLERVLDNNHALVQIRSSKPLKPSQAIQVLNNGEKSNAQLYFVERAESFSIVRSDVDMLSIFIDNGEIPLPPYIERGAEHDDVERYQTVYAKKHGAVAAPTAGLHFDDALLEQIKQKGVKVAYVTLHVGAGTYQPVRVYNILEHKMHKESFEVPQATIDAINKTRENNGRVIAVGTTTVRALETMASECEKCQQGIGKYCGDSEIFIYPGYQFKIIDGLVTNFHLPKSTLIMMISAFAGYDHVMNAYQFAIKQKMRFFSYGDSMLLWRSKK